MKSIPQKVKRLEKELARTQQSLMETQRQLFALIVMLDDVGMDNVLKLSDVMLDIFEDLDRIVGEAEKKAKKLKEAK